ncbi:MAG: ribokinase [Burkholderiales bacterium]
MVVVFGSINLDLVARVPRLPAPGETITGTGFAAAPGGKGANQALAARRAGADVALFGAVGRDAFASAALANLRSAGIDLSGVATVDAPTGIALINVDDRGENAIAVVPGANAHARSAQVPSSRLAVGTTLLMQLEVPDAEVVALAARARASGATVVLNAAPAVALPPALLSDVAVLVVNEHEAACYASAWGLPADAPAFMAAVRERFGGRIVITLGAEGAMTAVGHRIATVRPPPVNVVDTTGAGDAFAGALAAALDRGEGPEAALTAGVAAGAQACTYAGAQEELTATS